MAKQRNWASAAAMLAFTGFVALSLWAKWNPAAADDKTPPTAAKAPVQAKPADAAPAKGPQAKGKGAAKQKAKPAEFTRTIPGAGKKLDALVDGRRC